MSRIIHVTEIYEDEQPCSSFIDLDLLDRTEPKQAAVYNAIELALANKDKQVVVDPYEAGLQALEPTCQANAYPPCFVIDSITIYETEQPNANR